MYTKLLYSPTICDAKLVTRPQYCSCTFENTMVIWLELERKEILNYTLHACVDTARVAFK